MALSALSMSLKLGISGSGQLSVVGDDYTALKQPLNITKTVGPFTKSVANTAALGADECYSKLTTIAASGSADIDMTALVDLLNQSGISLARVKGYVLRLLSQTDDPDNGTLCTGITINGAGTNLATLPGLTGSQTIGNGDYISWGTPNATGTAISGTTKTLHIVNNDAAHAAAVQLTLIGGTT